MEYFLYIYKTIYISLLAYRWPISLQDRLVSTRFNTVNNTLLPRDCEACGKPKCSWCKGINKTTTFTSSNNNKTFKIFHSVNCQSSSVIYIIERSICNLQYIGKGSRKSASQRAMRGMRVIGKHKFLIIF